MQVLYIPSRCRKISVAIIEKSQKGNGNCYNQNYNLSEKRAKTDKLSDKLTSKPTRIKLSQLGHGRITLEVRHWSSPFRVSSQGYRILLILHIVKWHCVELDGKSHLCHLRKGQWDDVSVSLYSGEKKNYERGTWRNAYIAKRSRSLGASSRKNTIDN